MLTGKVRSQVANGTTYPENAFLAIDRPSRTLMLCLTQAGLQWPTVAIVVDLNTGHCGVRSMTGISAIVEQLTTPSTLIGVYPGTGSASSGRFFNLLSGTQGNGSNITATISKERFDMGNPNTVKTVKWVRPHIVDPVTSSSAITCEVAGNMTADGSISYGSAVTYTTGSSDKCDTYAKGRYLSFRFGSSTNIGRYGIAGFSVGYEETSVPAY